MKILDSVFMYRAAKSRKYCGRCLNLYAYINEVRSTVNEMELK